MSILKVARMGHPVLRQAAKPVDAGDLRGRDMQRLIEDMVETMQEYEGVGLAAPQVHVSKRVAVVRAQEDEEEDAELLVLVNPDLRPLSEDRETGWEGCLSIPEIRGLVPRWEGIAVKALSRTGRPLSFQVHGYPARVIQHEVDHLDGVLFLDRMTDLRSLSFLEEYARYVRGES